VDADPIPVSMIVAAGRRGEIGCRGELVFRIRGDMAHFRRTTAGRPLIMGRKTWESLPRRPLPGRPNIVLSRDPGFDAPGGFVFSDPGAGLAAARSMAALSGVQEVFIIGGAEVYASYLPVASRIWLTAVDAEAEADAFFPPPDPRIWREASCVPALDRAGDEPPYVIRELVRRV